MKSHKSRTKKCFVVNLSEPTVSVTSTEVSSQVLESLMSPEQRLKQLEKKVRRYRRKYLQKDSELKDFFQKSADLEAAVGELQAKVEAIEQEKQYLNETLSEQLRSKELEMQQLAQKTAESERDPGGLLSLSLENMQEKLFAKGQAISDLNLKISRLENEKGSLLNQLQQTRVELATFKALEPN